MQIKRATKNTLKITLNSNETRQLMIKLNSTDQSSKIFAEALTNILKIAEKKYYFFDASSELLVQISTKYKGGCTIYCTMLSENNGKAVCYTLSDSDNIINLYEELSSADKGKIRVLKHHGSYVVITDKLISMRLRKALEEVSIKIQTVSPTEIAHISEHGKRISL